MTILTFRRPGAVAPGPHGADPVDCGLAGLLRVIYEDLRVVAERDPSRRGLLEAAMHPPWHGLVLHRLARRLYLRGHRVRPALLTWVARIVAGMEIHAGARLGRRVFIDHGFGVVIGETAVVGDDVTLYHGVTLGSRGWWRDGDRDVRRHPVIGNRVTIGAGASVLGPITVADGCRVSAHALVVRDTPAVPDLPAVNDFPAARGLSAVRDLRASVP